MWKGDSTPAVFPRPGVAPGPPRASLLKVKIRKIIRRNPSKRTKKGSGFKHGIIQNANRLRAFCELRQKKPKKIFKQFPSSLQTQTQNRWEVSLLIQFTLDQGILTAHRFAMGGCFYHIHEKTA